MSAFGKLMRRTTDGYMLHCPGCNMAHHVNVGKTTGPNWEFNGDAEKPTFSPSVLVKYGGSGRICHSFIRDGQWQFLSDCTHELAGQTVPIPEWNEGDIWDF